MVSTLEIQKALKAKGFDPGVLDGVVGPRMEAAIIAFKVARGLAPRPYLGPVTLGLLLGKDDPGQLTTPWLNEVGRYMGLHETRDKIKLFAWLRSDKSSVGDPTKLPWCADLVETAIKLSLPAQSFQGKVKANPYYALNWLDFGVPTEMAYGAIAVFKRDGGGHIGFIVGYDPIRKRLRIRGGNQSNAVNDAWLDEARCVGYRWPTAYAGPKQPVPLMNSSGAVLSRNEA